MGVGDKDVELTVELCNNVIDGLFYQCLVSDIDLVGTALDAVCFLNIRSTVKCLLLLLYQIATFAPASAKPWVTAKPISAPAPETTAVLPLREKGGRARSFLGAIVLSVIAIK